VCKEGRVVVEDRGLGHRANNLIRFKAHREDWTVKGMTAGGWEREPL